MACAERLVWRGVASLLAAGLLAWMLAGWRVVWLCNRGLDLSEPVRCAALDRLPDCSPAGLDWLRVYLERECAPESSPFRLLRPAPQWPGLVLFAEAAGSRGMRMAWVVRFTRTRADIALGGRHVVRRCPLEHSAVFRELRSRRR